MNRLILLTLVIVFIVLPASQGQGNRLPTCSVAQLSSATSMRERFDTLVDKGSGINTLDDLLSFGTAQVTWRDNMWSQLPLCAELFQLGLLMDQVSETMFMGLSLQSAGVSTEANPYIEQGLQSAKGIQSLEEAISGAMGEGAATASKFPALRGCRNDERTSLAGDTWSGIVNLINTAYAVDSFAALLTFIDAKMAWRADIWSQLPPCKRAYEMATWMYRYSSDMAKIYMLDLYGVERSDNPYQDMYLEGLIQYSEYAQWMETAGTDYTTLPSCAESSIDKTLFDSFQRHHDWTQVPHSTAEDLPGFAEAHLSWRESLRAALPSLPGCREAFEAALLMLQISGDAATFSALTTSGIGFFELGSAYQERVVGAGNRIGQLNQQLREVPKTEDTPPEVSLVQCSEKDLDILFDDLQGFADLHDQARDIQGADDLIAYILALFEWRDLLWTALPACAEAFDIAALTITTLGDFATEAAMGLAGVPNLANPYRAQLELGIENISQWHAEYWAPLEHVEVPTTPTTTYFVRTNGFAVIHSCASVDCETVGIADDGEALEVVDAYGDWYQVYIGAGVIGYIHRDEVNSDPPGRE